MRFPGPVDRLFQRVMTIPSTPYLVVLVPTIVGTFRLLEESLWNPRLVVPGVLGSGFPGALARTAHFVTFYALLQLALALGLALVTRRKTTDLVGPVSVGLVFAWLPPLLELCVPVEYRRGFAYFRELDFDFFTEYQSTGESVTVWLVVAAAALFSGWLTRRWSRALLGALTGYSLVLALGWGWTTIARVVLEAGGSASLPGHGPGSTAGLAVVQLLGLLGILGLLAGMRPRSFLPSLARFNHALPWGLLAGLSARFAGNDWLVTIERAIIMALAFQFVALANDYLDREQDAGAGGTARPATADDLVLSTYLQVLLLAWALCFRPTGFPALLLALALSALYHLPPLRLKRLFCGSYRTEGLAAGACVLFGGQEPEPQGWLAVTMVLAIGGFSVGSWFKDYKDIDQDRAARVGTIYTRLLKRGRSLRGIHWLVRGSLTAMLLVPPLWLVLTERSWLLAIGLACIALLVGFVLLSLPSRKRAVEASLWGLTAYLAVFMVFAPMLSARPPAELDARGRLISAPSDDD